MRIGYFGGTFDPPHRAHLAVAEVALQQFALDKVEIAPTGHQPLKHGVTGASYKDRLAMVQLLCDDRDGLHASRIDEPHADGSANYTIDVLRTLAQSGDAVFSIVGADSFLDIRRWRESDELLHIADWIVVSRPGFFLDDLSSLHLSADQKKRVHLLQSVHFDISATQIRERLAQGDFCNDALTPEVARFIREHHLYRQGEDTQ